MPLNLLTSYTGSQYQRSATQATETRSGSDLISAFPYYQWIFESPIVQNLTFNAICIPEAWWKGKDYFWFICFNVIASTHWPKSRRGHQSYIWHLVLEGKRLPAPCLRYEQCSITYKTRIKRVPKSGWIQSNNKVIVFYVTWVSKLHMWRMTFVDDRTCIIKFVMIRNVMCILNRLIHSILLQYVARKFPFTS